MGKGVKSDAHFYYKFAFEKFIFNGKNLISVELLF